ncbi:UvrB/UvrC motif-containing protein [Cloacibacillus sp.]|uniref:UvrB/UvrC motif-containing protein n=1 Tax=Cloacibacillus sp. TaxID=2049023 RepID=UPI0025BDA7F3|nr:UvrB/UvrC motif-containing protein [Cloacibacillus sp.]MCC8057295.1 UvrB/UvrC motif-containing protein [Cloacibacillus sp.]MCC8179147.1 UvrB/UvrC motif-containing protein [Cloacibacillus sp.]
MLCEQCKVRRAEIHLVNVVNGERQVQHLCRECAEAHLHLDDVSNLLKMSFSVEGLMDIEEAFKELVIPALRGAYTRKRAARLCPHCGGVLPDSMFEGHTESQSVPPVAEEKEEDASARVMTAEEELSELSKKMEAAVKSENYEYAAQLRDRMAELRKSNMTQGSEL